MSQALHLQGVPPEVGCNIQLHPPAFDNIVFGPFLARSDTGKGSKKAVAKVKARYSKSDARYWKEEGRLVFHDSAELQVRLMSGGKRVWFSLGSANRAMAAGKAAEIWSYVQEHGLSAAVKEFKDKGSEDGGAAVAAKVVTVGDVVRVAVELSSARSGTLEVYVKAWRCMVSEMVGVALPEGMSRYDAVKGGLEEWRRQVDAVPLAQVTPAAVLAWKNGRMRAAADPVQARAAAVTVNSLLRNAGALFAKKLLPFLRERLAWDGQMPFAGVGKEKSPSLRYVSKMDAKAVLKKARKELMKQDEEGYKVVLLGLVFGLRRSEMDHLPWEKFDWSRDVLRIENTMYHRLKSEDSAGEIDVSAAAKAFLLKCQARATGPFVLEGPLWNPSRKRGYRCEATFARVLVWLRKQGVTSQRPLHTLRKEIGSLIAQEHGIFAASRYLRHADIRITASIYADKKKAITPGGLGGLVG